MNRAFPYRTFRPAAPKPNARQKTLAQWRGWDWSAEERIRAQPARSAGQVMTGVLSGLRMEARQAETEILRVWNNQIDPNIAAHAQPTGIRKGTLFVTVDSSVWLDEIVRYRRHEILERLQNSFGRALIVKISFRVG